MGKHRHLLKDKTASQTCCVTCSSATKTPPRPLRTSKRSVPSTEDTTPTSCSRGALDGVHVRLPTSHSPPHTEPGAYEKLDSLTFRKSSRCAELNHDGCIEVACGDGRVIVRDSTGPHGPILCMPPSLWRRVTQAIRANATDVTVYR
ncbi:DUF397 domain-containing protein [Actinomadura syzygii]|uniref:DUF397 domain-containing protein n=1 Tax=Actinomadura syzygii TaxID=1427538 RepID=A0A5D0TSB6_9ACTN|nr:DUF397 domain-containing protein [Actinomadura syzygii]TYC08727.1 DUF397 domain-containing protein [Actinomadura syzygii]